jgi:DNA-binding LacI/PurR family transcriptional regulator
VPAENGAQRVTLQTIADRVGVSRATVSNAYNRPDQLSPAVRERILEVAQELGYSGPHPAARRLRQGIAGAVGVLLTERLTYAFSDAAAVGFLEGLSRACEREGAALLLVPVAPGSEAAEAVHGAVCDAFCLYSLPDEHPAVGAALERHEPVVIVDSPRAVGATFVGIDDRRGAHLVAEHLLSLGHRRFGAIVPTLVLDGREGLVDEQRLVAASYHVDRERLAGLRDGLEAAGLDWRDAAIYECANTQEAGARAAAALLDGADPPTALVATTDQLALGAIRGVREQGLRVPDDVSVTGYDDIPDASRSEPTLTTVWQPLGEKGERAGDLIFTRLQGRRIDDITLPVRLVERESTAPPSRRS